MRQQYDKARADSISTKGLHIRSVGDVVSICHPQPKLPKLTFQWTEPTYVVTSVTPSTVTVRNLAKVKGGKAISHIFNHTICARRYGSQSKDDESVSGTDCIFHWRTSKKEVRGEMVHGCTVDWVDTDEGETLWYVTYEDFDEEQMTRAELSAVMVYHPLLDSCGDLEVPQAGTFVWYAVNQQPRLGKVISVDPIVSRPAAVEVYVPQAKGTSLSRARFVPAKDVDTENPHIDQITLHQIRLTVSGLTVRGYLNSKDRARLQRVLER